MQIRERISVEHSGTLLVLLFCPRTPPRKRAIEESEKIGLCRKAPPHNPLRPFGRVLGPRLSEEADAFGGQSKKREDLLGSISSPTIVVALFVLAIPVMHMMLACSLSPSPSLSRVPSARSPLPLLFD